MQERIFREAQALPAVSLSSVMAYQAAIDNLRAQVDTALAAHPDILALIGFSPLEMMQVNHRHHVQFMATVFRFRAYTLLPKVVVWVYRSYHKHGFSYDYFPLELRAWQTAIADQLPAAAAKEIHLIYQWLLDHHKEFCELADSETYTTFSTEFDSQDQMRILLSHMLNNNYRSCIDLAVESIHSTEDLSRFYQEVMTPALYEVGRLWERGEISAAQEHLATAISMRIMSAMYGNFVLGDASKGRAVITAAPNEYHEVGARMISDQLEMDGWQVDYLGANAPAADVLTLLRRNAPFMIGFSIVVPFHIEAVGRIIEAIRADKSLENIKVMVGGPAFSLEPELCQKIGADGCAINGEQAVALARKWWEERTG